MRRAKFKIMTVPQGYGSGWLDPGPYLVVEVRKAKMTEAETMEAIARVLGSAQQLAAALAVKRHLVLRWMNGTEVPNRRIWGELAAVLAGRMTRDRFPDTTAGREAAERHQSMVSLREQALGYSTQEAPLRLAKPRAKRVALPEELEGWNRE